MNYSIQSLYLCVTDMERALLFYENFFEQPPMLKDDIYSIFDVNGFHLGLFAFQKTDEPHSFGNSCLPSIAVENVEMLQKKLQGLRVVFPLKQIRENWVAEFEDSEGNHIEITAPIHTK